MKYPSWAARWKAAAHRHRQRERELLGLWSRLLITNTRRAEQLTALREAAQAYRAAEQFMLSHEADQWGPEECLDAIRRREAARERLDAALAGDADSPLLVELATLRQRAERAEADAAALRAALGAAIELRPEIKDDFQSGPAIRAALADDAGQALLAELAAARAVIATVKAVLARELSQSAVTVALARYDAAVKGASDG